MKKKENINRERMERKFMRNKLTIKRLRKIIRESYNKNRYEIEER